MNHTLALPPVRDVRAAIGPNVSDWAREHGHIPRAVNQVIVRYAGRDIDMTRVWGAQTRQILVDISRDLDAGRPAA